MTDLIPAVTVAVLLAAVTAVVTVEIRRHRRIMRSLPGLGVHLEGRPERKQQAAVRALYRHHHGRPDGDLLFHAVVEQVTAEEHPDCNPDAVAAIVAARLRSNHCRRLVAAAADLACGAHRQHQLDALDAIAAQQTGQPPKETP